jgi:hypothetical protein
MRACVVWPFTEGKLLHSRQATATMVNKRVVSVRMQ